MKNKLSIMAIVPVFLILILSGCKKDYKTKTVVNSDGSCERTIVLTQDGQEVKELKFPIPYKKNIGWNYKLEKDAKDSSLYVYTANKGFDDVNQLYMDYTDSNKIGLKVDFQKKFRWFYTFLNYKETYKRSFAYNYIPLNKYLTQAEHKSFLQGDTSKAISEKLNNYVMENVRIAFWMKLKDSIKAGKYNSIRYDDLYEKKNEIEKWLDNYRGGDKNIKAIQSIIKSNEATKLATQIDSIVNVLMEEITETSLAEGDFTNVVSMPGIIIATNATSINGNEASWKLTKDMFSYQDYEMMVESRVTNVWAFIVTGVVVLFLITLLIAPRFKKSSIA